MLEQSLDPDNGVLLSSERDDIGMPRAEWRLKLNHRDRESYLRYFSILAQQFISFALERFGNGKKIFFGLGIIVCGNP